MVVLLLIAGCETVGGAVIELLRFCALVVGKFVIL